MKANAPEKIYIQPNAHDGWFETNNPNESFTEYTRTDAFIEKACEWIKEKWDDSYTDPIIIDSVIENFKNYMKEDKV